MIAALKNIAPLLFYGAICIACLAALFGKARISFLLLVFLLPLRNVIERLYLYPFGKDALDILIICLIVGNVLLAAAQKQSAWEITSLHSLAAVVIVYTFVSYLYGNHNIGRMPSFGMGPDNRLQDWKNFSLLPILSILTFSIIRDETWARKVFVVICAAMVLMDYYMVDQLKWLSGLASREKLKGTFVYLGPNEVAAFYNQFTMLLCGVWFFIKKKWIKILLAVLICTNIYCVLFLFSRGAYIGLVVGLFFLFVNRRRVLLIPLILAILSWQTVLPEEVKQRIVQTRDESGELDQSSAIRLQIWEKAFEMFQSNPVVGLGFGTFREQGLVLGDTHNVYLKILAEQGIIGFLIFISIILLFLRQGWGLYRNAPDGPAKGLGLGFVGCVLTLLVNNMFGDRWTYIELSAYLWIFAGLVARLNILYTPQSRLTEQKNSTPPSRIHKRRSR